MKWIIVGLGNPGGEYAKTRHNVGRIVLDAFREENNFPEWDFKKTYQSLISKNIYGEKEVLLLEPETYMNESGKSLITLVKSAKQSAQLIVIHDDIDIALGAWKISWNRNSGGHNGIESIATTLKTKEFIRVRVGIAPVDTDGVIKKPKGESAVIKFVLGKFREEEMLTLQKISPAIHTALSVTLTEGVGVAMNRFN